MKNRILKITFESTNNFLGGAQDGFIELYKSEDNSYYATYAHRVMPGKEVAEKKRVSEQSVSKINDLLVSITLPAFPRHSMGCDGGFTEIEVGGYGGGSKFRWWSAPPEGWEELNEVTSSIIELCGHKIA